MKRSLLLLALIVSALAQTGPTVNVTDSSPQDPYSQLLDYAGGSNLTYVGLARGMRTAVTLTVTSISTANPAVVTVTAHGLQTDNAVQISGGTGNWAGINGKQIITRTAANTFTIPVDTSAYTGTFAGTMTTTAPRTSAAIWSIKKLYYDGSNNLLRTSWAAGTTAENQVWDNRASLSYQ